MTSPKPQPSTAFASREFNGEVLLDELSDLRSAQVPSAQLSELAASLRVLGSVRVPEAAQHLKQLAATRFSSIPAVSALLNRWAGRLRVEADVGILVNHFERLAITAAIVNALRQAGRR